MSIFRKALTSGAFRRLRAAIAALVVVAGTAGAWMAPAGAPAAAAFAAAVVSVAASPSPASAAGSDPFGDTEQKGQDVVKFLFKMARLGALIGIVVVVVLGFFGSLNWGTVFYIAMGCMVIAIAPSLVDWLGSDQFASPNL